MCVCVCVWVGGWVGGWAGIRLLSVRACMLAPSWCFQAGRFSATRSLRHKLTILIMTLLCWLVLCAGLDSVLSLLCSNPGVPLPRFISWSDRVVGSGLSSGFVAR